MPAEIQIAQTEDEQFFYRVVAGNGETLCHSEAFTRIEDAERGAHTLVRAIFDAASVPLVGVTELHSVSKLRGVEEPDDAA